MDTLIRGLLPSGFLAQAVGPNGGLAHPPTDSPSTGTVLLLAFIILGAFLCASTALLYFHMVRRRLRERGRTSNDNNKDPGWPGNARDNGGNGGRELPLTMASKVQLDRISNVVYWRSDLIFQVFNYTFAKVWIVEARPKRHRVVVSNELDRALVDLFNVFQMSAFHGVADGRTGE
jgi:hypothetical protein